MPRPPYRWDARSARYRDARGRFLARQQVRTALDGAIERSTAGVRALAEQYRAGRISLAEWELQMRRLVKDSHIASMALARGGLQHMDAAAYGRVGRQVRDQYAYLSRFARQLATNEIPFDGRATQRMLMYLEHARTAYHVTERAEMETRGLTHERNVLGVADHCGGWLDATDMGWVPIGTLPPIGGRDCLSRCRCHIRYGTEEDARAAA